MFRNLILESRLHDNLVQGRFIEYRMIRVTKKNMDEVVPLITVEDGKYEVHRPKKCTVYE
jgi:hypothetical protein